MNQKLATYTVTLFRRHGTSRASVFRDDVRIALARDVREDKAMAAAIRIVRAYRRQGRLSLLTGGPK